MGAIDYMHVCMFANVFCKMVFLVEAFNVLYIFILYIFNFFLKNIEQMFCSSLNLLLLLLCKLKMFYFVFYTADIP